MDDAEVRRAASRAKERRLRMHRREPWIGLSLLVVAAITVANAVLDSSVAFLGLLGVGPVIASTRLNARITALIGAYALLIAGFLVTVLHFHADVSRWIALASLCGVAVWMAWIRASREQAVLRLAAEHDVTRSLYESDDVPGAAFGVLKALGERLCWEVGTLWQVGRRGDMLVAAAQWWSDGRHEPLPDPIGKGVGLAGLAWERKSAVWSQSADGLHASEDEWAAKAGMTVSLAFPLLSSGKVVGVIVFHGTRSVEVDEQMHRSLHGFARQIGQFLDRKRAEEAARDVEVRRSAVIQSAIDAIVGISHEGKITEWNPAAERMFGFDREEACGRSLEDTIIPAPMRAAHRLAFERYLRDGDSRILDQRIEVQAQRRDGTIFPAELTITRVPLPGPPAFSGYIRDITSRLETERELREREARFRALFDTARDSVLVFDDEGRFQEANPAALALFGCDLQTLRSKTFADFAADPDGIPAGMSRLKEDGSWSGDWRICVGERQMRTVAVSSTANFVPGLHLALMRDMTERVRQEQEDRFLAQSARVLADSSLQYDQALQRVADLAVPEIADWCAIDMPVGRERIVRVALAHTDQALRTRVEQVNGRYPQTQRDGGAVATVLHDGKPLLIETVDEAVLAGSGRAEPVLDLARELGVRSLMIVPMIARGRTLGAITFVSSNSGRRFDQEDLAFAVEVAGRCALAVDNARLYAERTHQAKTLQESLLPPQLPDVPGLNLAARYQAAGEGNDVGGDFYDVFDTGDGRWAVVLGDVCGKGAEAAALTALTRYTVRALAPQEASAAGVLRLLNAAIRRQRTDGRFCTVAFAFLTPDAGGVHLQLALGGHPKPLVRTCNGQVREVGIPGTLIGVVDDPDLHDCEMTLQAGETLVLFSDGLTDRRTDEGVMSCDDRVRALLAGAADAQAAAEVLADDAVSNEHARTVDDVAVLAISVPFPVDLSLTYPTSPKAVGALRSRMRTLRPRCPDLDWNAVELMVAEMATNAVRYGTGERFEVRICGERDGGLRVEVINEGAPFDFSRDLPEQDSITGRGLFIVGKLADRWDVEMSGGTVRVWMVAAPRV